MIVMSYIAKVYADALIAGKRKFSTIPEKIETEVFEELQNRVQQGIITEEQLEKLLED